MTVKKYDARDVHLIVDGRVVTGFGANDMFSVSYNEDRLKVTVDAQGNTEAAINNSRLGKVTVNLSGNSVDHKRFNELGNSMKDFKLSCDTGYEIISASECYITKLPTANYGKNTPGRSYVITCCDLSIQVK